MKKKKTKRKISKNRTAQNNDLGDFGLEPPKIYRDSQKRMAATPDRQIPSRSQRNENISRNEKRARQTNKRKKRNKFRKVLIWFAVAIVLISVMVVLSLTVFFHIESINVNGNERYSAEEILAQCTINAGENLFLADTDSAADRIEQSLPYIYNAEITRKLPSSIEINITEAEPSYYIENGEKGYILLDNRFKVLETEAEQGSGIFISQAEIKSSIAGQKIEFEDENTGECLEKLAAVITDNHIDEITAIYSNNISDNYVVYDNRINFKLGSCDNAESKIWQGLASCEKLDETNPNVSGTMTINGDKQIYFTEE